MTANGGFVLGLGAAVAALLFFGLKFLPRENMQILASIPVRRRADGRWQGVNLTWYGVMQSLAMVSGVGLALVLARAADVPMKAIVLMVLGLIAIALPAAKVVALIVERRRGTLTVGGAIFVATLAAPWAALAVDRYVGAAATLPMIAALAAGYTVGEGVGRLACISFGCCYGKRLRDCPSWLQTLLAGRGAIVVGPTRKAAYASKCDGVPLVPVPAMSAIVLTAAGVSATAVYLDGRYRAAILVALGVAFSWRFASEFLRADFRGGGRLSAYQWMAVVCLVYAIPVALGLPTCERRPDVHASAAVASSPVVLLGMAALGVLVFVYLGVSSVTTATIELDIHERYRS